MRYTNKGLVAHAKNALALNTRYMWGGILRPITPAYVDLLSGIYGEAQYSQTRINMLKALNGKNYFGVDCVGLVKSYYWSGNENGGTGSRKYGEQGYPDVNANVMFNNARVKGDIRSIPEVPGLVVYCKSHPHVGVYIGNGEVIESTIKTAGDGVIKTKLKDWKWEYWFECPYIEYIKDGVNVPDDNVGKFSTGDKVKIKKSADKYAGSSIKIPEVVKGVEYTVDRVMSDRVRLQPINSWVRNEDVERT